MTIFQPGAADPYWYEWFVGLDKLISLIDPSTNIDSVTFQHSNLEGIDDVVVRFTDETPPCCYQVKHTRTEESVSKNFTFGSLIAKSESGKTLIKSLANGWNSFQESNEVTPTIIVYSNKKAGPNKTSACFDGLSYKCRPIDDFFELLSDAFQNQGIDSIPTFADKDLNIQLRHLIAETGLDEQTALRFLNSIKLDLSKPSLSDAENNLIQRLKAEVCNGQESLAQAIFKDLCAELRYWTTSGEGNVVTKNEVLKCIAQENEHPISSPIVVPIPNPIFPSRADLSKQFAQEIYKSENAVFFISGVAGSGKTRLISSLHNAFGEAANVFRFHVFKPLDVDDFSYSPDRGIVDAKSMWATFINHLRKRVDNPYEDTAIPVINELCNEDQLRFETIRLAELLFKQSHVYTILIIDGIDHAARAENELTFLSHLPAPETIPLGIKFVLVGQPKEGYPAYPAWLQSPEARVEEMSIPDLGIQDVKHLLKCKSDIPGNEINAVAAKIMELTGGNTLSVIYGCNTISQFNKGVEAIDALKESGLCSNVEEYYKSIWNSARATIMAHSELTKNPLDILICAAHLFDGLLDPESIAEAFPDEYKHAYLVEEHLLLLNPLFSCGLDGVYRPLHNDFRLFISQCARSRAMQPCLKYVVETLADYLVQKDCGLIRSCFGIRVLSAANRVAECLKIFDTDFVISAIAQGAPWSLMEEQAVTVYEMACNSRDLVNVQRAQSAIATLSQINERTMYYEQTYPNIVDDCLSAFDVIRIPLNSNSVFAYKAALERILWLQSADAIDASSEMFEIWYGPFNPSAFVALLQNGDDSFQNIEHIVSEIMILWGRYSAQIGKEYVECTPDYVPDQSFEESLRCFKDGFVIEKLRQAQTTSDAQYSMSSLGLSAQAIKEVLNDYLIGRDQISNASFLYITRKLIAQPEDRQLLVTQFMAIALSNGEVIEIGDLEERLLRKRNGFYYSSDSTFQLVAESFLFGYYCGKSGFKEACSEAEELLFWIDPNENNYLSLINRVRASVCLGYSAAHHLTIAKATPEAECMERYMNQRHERSFEFHQADLLLQYMINTGSTTRLTEGVLSNETIRSFLLGPLSTKKARLIERLIQAGATSILREMVDEHYGQDGSVLLLRDNPLEDHKLLRHALEAIDPDLARKVNRCISATASGFTDHKDYSLNHLVELFKIGMDRGSINASTARRLQIIDLAASNAGGNRMSEAVRDALINWSSCEPLEDLIALWNRDIEFIYDYSLLIKQFDSLLAHANAAEEICSCFAVVYGSSSYYDASELENVHRAAQKCFEVAKENGCTDLVKSYISDVINRLPERPENSTNHAIDEFSASYENKENARRKAVITLEDEELSAVAFEESMDYWDWTRVHVACEELISRGLSPTEVYEELAERRQFELAQGGWEHSSAPHTAVIRRIACSVSDEHFFNMLRARKENLCQYGFGTASTDIAFAIRERLITHLEYDIDDYFNIEYESKLRWLTANKAFRLEDINGSTYHGQNIIPSCNLSTLCADFLIDSLIENDPHRSEDATRSLAWVGAISSLVRERCFERFGGLAPRARTLILKLAAYWLQLGHAKIETFFETALLNTENCSEFLLISIALGKQFSSLNMVQKGSFASNSEAQILPPLIRRFLDDAEVHGIDCADIRHEIEWSTPADSGKLSTNVFFRREDVECPIYPTEKTAEKILYREYANGRWGIFSKCYMAARLIDPSDVWIMSSLPIYKDTRESGIEAAIAELEDGRDTLDASSISAISNIGLNPNELLLGWKLYIPFNRTDQYKCTQVARVAPAFSSTKKPIIDMALGCYGLLASDLGDNQSYFDPSFLSLPLFCLVGGCITMTYCDAQIVPADTLYDLGLMPKRDNPLIWIDDFGTPVIRYERIIFPISHGYSHEAYYRQPQVWRWVCNQSVFEKILSDHACILYYVNDESKGTDPLLINQQRKLEEDLMLPF